MPIARLPYRIVGLLIISLPAFLLVCALILPWIQGATGLFTDGPGPWYQPVTAPVFLASTAVWMFLLRIILGFFTPRATKAV